MKRSLGITVMLAAMMCSLSCSSTSSNKVTSGPGDPTLTYDPVVKNVNDHIGKRVRWYGKMMSSESTGSITRIVYGNTEQWQTGGDMQPFVVEYKLDWAAVMKMPSAGWITGTIEGTHTIGMTLGSPSGRETRTPQTVPLLSHAEIEGASGQNTNNSPSPSEETQSSSDSSKAKHDFKPQPVEPQNAKEKKAYAKAQKLLERVRSGEDFAKVAQQNSDDPGSKNKGGDLGYFKRGEMIPDFDHAVFALNPGEISNIIKTLFGYHIIKVEEYKDRGTNNETVHARHILISIRE